MESRWPMTILQERGEFVSSMQKNHEIEFGLLESLADIGRSMMVVSKRDPLDELRFFKEILLGATVRTVNRIDSSALLLVAGQYLEAELIVRAVFEEFISLKYIEKDPVLRSFLNLRHGSKERIKALQRELKRVPNSLSAKPLQDRVEYFEQEKSLYDEDIKKLAPEQKIPEGLRWSGCSIREMAEEVNEGEAYEVIYSDLSSIAHSHSSSAHQSIKYDDDNDRFIPLPAPSEGYTYPVVGISAWFSLEIFRLANKNLEAGKAERLIELETEITKHFSVV